MVQGNRGQYLSIVSILGKILFLGQRGIKSQIMGFRPFSQIALFKIEYEYKGTL